MTDDDREVTPDWLRRIADAFPADPRIGIVFGNVLAGPHDRTQGFIPAYQRREPFLAKSIRDKHRIEGIGASMAIRRTAWEALNGFDENFGAGGRFGSAEELEFTVRALVSGFAVYAEPAAAVVHHGFRTWESGRELISGYLYGIGAMFAKLLKLGHWSILYLMFQLASRWAFQGPVVDLGRKPPRLLRLSAFVRGFLAGLAFPIDRRRGHYARAKSAPAAKVVAQN
jgi:GT2 family glycosyltransferase